MYPLVLEAIKPALGRCVVPAVFLATHQADHAVFLQLGMKDVAGILAASVGVVNQSSRRFSPEPRHRQRINHDICRHVRLERPAHHLAVEQIEYDCRI